ncbi:SNF2-related protein [Pyxidicoccus sp. 3LG]
MAATTHSPRMRAEVATVEHQDQLCVTPLDAADKMALIHALRTVAGTVRFDSGGVCIPASRASLLLGVENLDLRWTEAALRFAENRSRVQATHGTVRVQVEAIKAGGPEHARSLLRDLDDIDKLDGHQLVNVAAMTVPGSPGLCVFDEQGAGKTVTLIFAFDLLVKRQEADLIVVVAPKSMIAEWPKDLARFKGDLYRVAVITGSRREKVQALRSAPDFIVTNFETAVAMEAELTALLRARDGRGVLTVDESFYAKNLDAARTRTLRRLREWCRRAYVLCGTPAPNTPQDLVQQFNLVDFGLTFADVQVPKEREAATPVVQHAIGARGLYVRHLKQDVLPDLPGKTFQRILCPLQPHQQRLYQSALQSLIIDVRATDDATFNRQLASFLARRMALLQICSHPGMVAEGYDEVPAKQLALDALLEELIGRRGEKVVLWSYFRQSLEQLADRYSRYGVIRYDGSVTDVNERREGVRRFQEDDDTRLFIANPAAAGAGLTLHRSRIAIYESFSNQAAHYLQSLDRIHRRGQEREVEYLMLLGDGTIEQTEYETLLRKERSAQELLGDHVEPAPTRQSMLTELLFAAHQANIEVAP